MICIYDPIILLIIPSTYKRLLVKQIAYILSNILLDLVFHSSQF